MNRMNNPIIQCYEETVDRLKERPRSMSFKKISESTGLSKDWLAKLSRGNWNDPGIKKIATLHDYLFQQSENNPSNDEAA